ncbi:longitudinals lacking protein, isoforms H/M/V isoform X4 [Anoplophora glabripennis]|uniref:longitudinals lacking protein, isoforms H/M/V isoform X4 n=1 Tax=Anoplophora glabripennis TaxID=217634 RepID=UPI000873FBDD|nr:longitudinals lacking protein, isoforms H/M/V isoform X4 [Anoplophora glabripennis]
MSSDVTKQFAVNWNNHMNHVKKAFDNLLVNSELTDVILYAEGKKVGAHKMLLSACSNYFRSLFREFPQEHPIIVLKGVSYPVLTDILKFIYNGEVSVDSDVFDNFLQTAEFLQISGLTDGGKNTKKIQNGDKDTVKDDSNMNDEEHGSLVESKTKKEKRSNVDAEQNTQSKRPREETEFNSIKCEPGVLTAIFPEELSDTLQEASQFPPELILQAGSNVSVDDSAMKSSSSTVPSVLYDCEICGKSYKLKDSLSKHLSVHAGYTTCIICSKVLSRKTHLDRHMMQTHGILSIGGKNTVTTTAVSKPS